MKFSFQHKTFIEHEIEPTKWAIIGENKALNWLEFEQAVESVCAFFKSKSWDQLQFPVLLFGHKETEMIVAMYACMKMEIPYIPTDVVYPKERLISIQKIAGCELIINCTTTPLKLENTTEIQFTNGTLECTQTAAISCGKTPTEDPLIYIIFTSGSTGEPKGVQISTEAIRDFTQWMIDDFGFTANDVFINIALLSFDLSVYEVMSFGALGATLLLNAKKTTENPAFLLDRIKTYQGTIWVSTPSFSFIYSRIEDVSALQSLKYFLFCGELLPHPLAKTLIEKFPTACVYNTYGPTEATVATTQVVIDAEILAKYNPLPVGKSKPRSKLLIENDEIIIVGKNVSKGYLNRPELNAEKFITIDHERAFKTGDTGYLENEMLFFKGRNDDQVKLHGYRIELNEITSKINEIECVLQAETIALKRNEEVKKIVSLISIQPSWKSQPNLLEMIQSNLTQSLPPYMIPSDFKIVENIPLNQNGKADKKLLEQMYLQKN